MNTLIKTGFGIAGVIFSHFIVLSFLSVSRWHFPEEMFGINRLSAISEDNRIILFWLAIAFFCFFWMIGFEFTKSLDSAKDKARYIMRYIKSSLASVITLATTFVVVSYLQLAITAFVKWNHKILLLNQLALFNEMTSPERLGLAMLSFLIGLLAACLVATNNFGKVMASIEKNLSEVFEGRKEGSKTGAGVA